MSLFAVACAGSAGSELGTALQDSPQRNGAAPTTPATVEPAAEPTPPATEPTTSTGPEEDGATASGTADSAGAAQAAAEPTATTEIPEFVPPTGIVPTRIAIPTIDVDAPTIELSLAGAEPEVPVDFDDAGWYTQTRLPGEIGPAVIAGHIDSRSGPAVFARLDQLEPGDEITVTAADGESRVFEVFDAAQYPKGDLPQSVFGFGTPEPELRLITCGGTFDAEVGHYRDNYVVFARLIG